MYAASKRVVSKGWAAAAAALADAGSLTRYGVLALAGWLVTTLLLGPLVGGQREPILYLSMLGLHGLLLHGFCFYYLIPELVSKGRGLGVYLAYFVGMVVVSSAALVVVMGGLTQNPTASAGFGLVNGLFHLIITAPLSWGLFQRQARRNRQIAVLETELGQSNASLDFLRAQINPHFLFNALNTLYGMALQENSERTAQGVQMLGDMMRFMLHENHQRVIQLAREVEYLHHYIALQELRTATTAGISITTMLADVPPDLQIAPMLLIPFVENAFKHGISLQHPSWITTTLECRQRSLVFEVRNSTHVRPATGLAPAASGVGLENVRQRLALLYPDRHTLVIRQTPAEYFVRLTLAL